MPHKFHSTIRLGGSSRLAIFNIKRMHTVMLIGATVAVVFAVLAVRHFR
jgi:hypothetical protein